MSINTSLRGVFLTGTMTLALSMLVASASVFAQLTGTKTVGTGGDYATIAAAITDLNSQGVGAGGVTFNVAAGHTETSANLVVAITANQPTAANPVVFQKNGSGANPLITAAPGVTTNLDAIIKFVGTDYTTFDGLDLLDPPSNNTFTTMMEQGYALLRASSTDGCQNVVIKNCAITLQKTNIQSSSVFSTGIFVANRDINGVTVNATDPAGLNSYNRLFGNTISNMVVGIRFLGPSTAGQRDFDNEIGVVGEASNTITDFAGSGTTANAEGIRIEGQMNVKIINNVISGGIGHTYVMYGILVTTGGSNPGTGNYEIAYNTVTLLSSPTSYTQYAIRALANGDTVRIHHNTVENSNISASTTASFWGIAHDPVGNPATNLSLIHDNIIRNNTLSGTTGDLVGILAGSTSSGSMPSLSVYSNQIHNNQKTGSGELYGIQTGNASVSCYSNIAHDNSSAATLYGYYNSASNVIAQNVYDNTFYSLSAGAEVYGIYANTSSSSNTSPKNVYGNTVYGVSATGNGTAVGIYHRYGGASQYYRNNIYNVSTAATDTSNFAAGIVVYNVLSTSASTIFNNFVSDVRAPNSGSRNAVIGINGIGSSSGSSLSAYYNTIYLNATSSGTNFGSSGISVVGHTTATNATHDFRNNIVVNLSTSNGTGVTTALRRITNTSLNNYSLGSNNNDFYAGAPSASRLIYYDGTNSDQTLTAFQARVTPREAASFSIMPAFLNGTTPPYDLHIDTTVASQIESGGAIVSGIDTDVDDDLRFGAPGYAGTGTAPDVGADEFEGALLPPMAYVSSTTTQNSDAVFANTTNNHIVGIEVVTSGFSGPLEVTSFTLNTNGSTNATGDISTAKIFYTGTSSTFGTALLFGSSASPPPAPSTYTITGSQGLVNGTNYFWLAYDIPQSATGGNVVDGEVPSITIEGIGRTPSVTAPAGSRSIIGSLSGTYTISPSQPYPFDSFTNVAALLGSAGVSGPVMFNVQPGPARMAAVLHSDALVYNEQVEFTAIPGASSTNTVTINGNGETISFAPTSANRHVIKLNGAQWMTLDNLMIVGTDTTFGWGIHLINGANNNTISNCMIDLSSVKGTTQSNSAGIVASNSSTSVTTAGNNANRCVISGNTIQGGAEGGPWQGIRLNGNTGGVDAVGNQIVNNVVRDFHAEGITLSNADSALVRSNDISRPNKTTVTIFQGVTLNAGCRNVRVEKNLIHNTNDNALGVGQSATAYGIYFNSVDAPAGSENIAANNMIYAFNSTTGIAHGIRNSGSDGAYCFFNSISLDHPGSTAGETRGFYQLTTASNIEFRNNIISITRGGTGTKHCLNFGASASTIVSNNNVLYINAPAGTNNVGFLTSNYATLTDWQTTGHDANSVAGNPLFTSSSDLHITSDSSSASNAGAPVAAVTDDFDSELRNATTPDIGADEFSGSNTVTVCFPTGLSWTLVSLCVRDPIPDDSVKHLFPCSVNPYAFAFVGGYVQRFVMEPGKGYWIKCSSAGTVCITGTRIDTLTIPVASGWNMIGSISTSIDTSNVESSVPGLRASNFFKYSTGYSVAATIDPGSGYWVKANSTGWFFLHSTGPAGTVEPGSAAHRSIKDLNTLTIEDANGGSQTLYFGADANGDVPLTMFAMPPAPPLGSFDARFESSEGGLMVQTHADEVNTVIDFPISIQSSAYPVTVSWRMNGAEASYELSDGVTSHKVRGEGTLKITNSSVQQLVLKVTGSGVLPEEFALMQNYPNPFNPTTSIKFALPVESRVTVEIYNVLGQKVKTLLSEQRGAGYHTVEWNGTGTSGQQVGSGLYFLRLASEGSSGPNGAGKNFTDVRKLMLLK